MTEDTVFSKIIRGDIPADIVFQDERVTAFRDINPQTPTHILIVPNKTIPTAADITEEHEADVGHMMVIAAKLAHEEGIAEDGFRLIINSGRNGRQEVLHLHLHLMGGRDLGRMLANKVI